MNTFVTPRWLMEEATAMTIDRVIPTITPVVREAVAKMSDDELHEFACELGRALHPQSEDEDE